MMKKLAIIGLLIGIICGCAKESEQKKVGPAEKKSGIAAVASEKWNALPADAVVIRIGSNTCTKSACEAYARMMWASAEIKNPNVPREKLDATLLQNWPRIKEEVVTRMLMDAGIQVTNKVDWEPYRAVLKKQFAARLSPKKQKITFEKIQSEMEKRGLLETFMKSFEQDLKIRVGFATVYSNDLAVTDAEYRKVRANVDAWNQRAQATNRVNQATANHVRRLLDEGDDFAKLANAYSQDKNRNPGGDLGECDINSLVFTGMDAGTFEQTTYWRTVSALKDGQISPVLETDVGWEIVKMIEHVSATNSNTGVASYHLARIYFRRAYMFPDQDEEEFKEDVRAEKREELLKKIQHGVLKGAKVQFPQGEDVFKARESAEKGAKKPQGPLKNFPSFQKAGKPKSEMPKGLKD